jgi:hypothetical protein
MKTREIVIEQRLETEDDWLQEVWIDGHQVLVAQEPMRFSGWGPHLRHLTIWHWLRLVGER